MNIDNNINDNANANANEIIYEENTNLSSEEELMKSVNNIAEEEVEDDEEEDVDKSNEGFLSYFNTKTVLLFIGLLVLLYFVFKKDVDNYISNWRGSTSTTDTSMCA